uniref:Uncharacterized protein n=1 Tax=Lepeophtheirus salmonis TaxID=72036 RepID=A0A0K2V102_LEPSM
MQCYKIHTNTSIHLVTNNITLKDHEFI